MQKDRGKGTDMDKSRFEETISDVEWGQELF